MYRRIDSFSRIFQVGMQRNPTFSCSLPIIKHSISINRRTFFAITNTHQRKQESARNISSYEAKSVLSQENAVSKIMKKIRFVVMDKSTYKAAGYFLYETIADNVNHLEFFEELNLPDTFYSWFVIMELHIWMLSVRAMAEGDEGKLIRNGMLEALWNDVKHRANKLGAVNPSATRSQIAELSEQLQAAFIAYDEGLQSDDTVLAGALWRRVYQQQDVDIEHLELLVKYIRKEIKLIDNISKDNLLHVDRLDWKPSNLKGSA